MLCTAQPCGRRGAGSAGVTLAGLPGVGKAQGKSAHGGHFPYVSYLKVINQANKPLNETCSVLYLVKHIFVITWEAKSEFRILGLAAAPGPGCVGRAHLSRGLPCFPPHPRLRSASFEASHTGVDTQPSHPGSVRAPTESQSSPRCTWL